MDNLGVNFAPTTDAALNGPRNGQLSGVPQAIQILSLALPKMGGVRPPSPLVNGAGGQGMDPAASALLQTLMKTLGLHSMGLPGGTAGPNPPMPRTPEPGGPFGKQGEDPMPQAPSSDMDYTPRVVFQPDAPATPSPNYDPFRSSGGFRR